MYFPLMYNSGGEIMGNYLTDSHGGSEAAVLFLILILLLLSTMGYY